MESLAQLRGCNDKLDQFKGEDGRFYMFKLADDTRSERPVHYIMTQELFVDLSLRGSIRIVILHAGQLRRRPAQVDRSECGCENGVL